MQMLIASLSEKSGNMSLFDINQCDTRSCIMAGKIKGAGTVYNKTIKR